MVSGRRQVDAQALTCLSCHHVNRTILIALAILTKRMVALNSTDELMAVFECLSVPVRPVHTIATTPLGAMVTSVAVAHL
jgi:hypothetical protein